MSFRNLRKIEGGCVLRSFLPERLRDACSFGGAVAHSLVTRFHYILILTYKFKHFLSALYLLFFICCVPCRSMLQSRRLYNDNLFVISVACVIGLYGLFDFGM